MDSQQTLHARIPNYFRSKTRKTKVLLTISKHFLALTVNSWEFFEMYIAANGKLDLVLWCFEMDVFLSDFFITSQCCPVLRDCEHQDCLSTHCCRVWNVLPKNYSLLQQCYCNSTEFKAYNPIIVKMSPHPSHHQQLHLYGGNNLCFFQRWKTGR